MKKTILAFLAILALAACGPIDDPPALAKQASETPVAIASAGGVTLFKVRDVTPGGVSVVYFTAPCGDVSWHQPKGKTSERRMVAGPACE